jgi:hypothetical protein
MFKHSHQRFRNAILVLAILFPVLSHGQAIRLNYFGASYFENTSKKHYYYGFGYEQNVGTHISVSLEYNRGYSFDEEDEYLYLQYAENGNTYDIEYYNSMPWSEYSYQSKYFFNGNEDDGWYISSGVSIRTVKYELFVASANVNGNYAVGLFPESPGSKSITLFPISLKFGYRNAIDWWFQDYMLGISYIPGGSTKPTGYATIDNHATQTSFKNLAITFSLSFGIGWAD